MRLRLNMPRFRATAVLLLGAFALPSVACDMEGTPGQGGSPSPFPLENSPTPGFVPPSFGPLAPSGPDASPGPGAIGGMTERLSLTARTMAFDRDTLSAPAGADVELDFTNLDSVQHNFALYEDASMNQVVFSGDILSGQNQAMTTYEFTAPSAPGEYAFFCEIHPDQMSGAFIVE